MTSSDSPFVISGMTENNARHEKPVRDFLDTIITIAPEHARFMNMLSMLEHMGSRKIMVSQMNKTLTEDILKHLAEEARHAYFFKRQAERIAKKPLDGYTQANTMALTSAQMYFGRLDAGIARRVSPKMSSRRKPGSGDLKQPDPVLQRDDRIDGDAYPWVSLIIELRACWLYRIYQEALQAAAMPLSLKSLLAEEDMHLAEMFEMCGENHARLRDLCAYETALFAALWNQLENALDMAQAA